MLSRDLHLQQSAAVAKTGFGENALFVTSVVVAVDFWGGVTFGVIVIVLWLLIIFCLWLLLS